MLLDALSRWEVVMRRSSLVLGLAILWAGCKTGPEAGPAGAPALVRQEMAIPEQGLTDFRIRFEGDLTSPIALTADRATYEVVVEGKVIKSGEAKVALQLAAGETKPFTVEGGSQYVRSAEELKEVSAKGGTLLAAIRGKLYVTDANGKKHELDFARSRDIRVPRLPTVKLHELDGARYSAEEVNAVFYLGVVNPNPFPIRLAGLKYTVKMAGKQLADGTIGAGEKVDPAATGVFEVHADFNKQSFGADAPKVIKSHNIPYEISGELTSELVKEPYELKGDMKLNVSK
jgi:LEA14-like dessication related protein